MNGNVKKSTAQLADSQYAERTKALLQVVKELRAMGGQAVVDLPRIVVIGNQSAGKSSVVEAISGINVPRDPGTCTRCPMECRLTYSPDSWSCQVSIRWEFDSNFQPVSRVAEIPFGDLITNKKDVELALRRAQTAILNPSIESHKFLAMTADQLRKGVQGSKPLLFSKNVVCVDLQGPDLTDLAFIDLPGLIQNAEDKLVKLVEELVVSHIRGNSLILVALPMTDDIDNQKALALAREADPQGKRTIGVLTKVDVIAKGSKSRSLWLDVIEGRSNPLLHGYYCTRQPDDAEREAGISAEDARRNEMSFFEQEAPWSTSSNKGRFGIHNLVSRLSPLLSQIIKNTLPKVAADATSRLETCDVALSGLPQPLDTEPATYMLNLITALCEDVKTIVEGLQKNQSLDTKLIQGNRKIYTVFRDNIRSTCPNFAPRKRNDKNIPAAEKPDGESDAESEDSANPPIYLDDMRSHITNSVKRELPNNVPYEAKVKLIGEFQDQWGSMASQCLDRVCNETTAALLLCVDRTFSRWDSLHSQMRLLTMELIQFHLFSCRSFVDATLEVERMPYTQNTHYLQSSVDKWLAKYKTQRKEENPSPALAFAMPDFSPNSRKANGFDKSDNAKQQYMREALAILARIGYPGLKEEDLGRLHAPDEYETELDVMAEVRGYFQVAYKRVIDNVPSLIDLKLLNGIAKDIQSFLIKRMELGTPEARKRCEMFFAEDPSIVARRQELLAQKEKLEMVKVKLYDCGF